MKDAVLNKIKKLSSDHDIKIFEVISNTEDMIPNLPIIIFIYAYKLWSIALIFSPVMQHQNSSLFLANTFVGSSACGHYGLSRRRSEKKKV